MYEKVFLFLLFISHTMKIKHQSMNLMALEAPDVEFRFKNENLSEQD